MDARTALMQEAAWAVRSMQNSPEAQARMMTYNPKIDLHRYQCPKCWVRQGVRSAMRSAHGTDEYDVLRCNNDACGAEVIVPF